MLRLQIFWDHLRGTYWFIPLLMTIAASILAYILVKVDMSIPNSNLQDKWYIIHLTASDNARTLAATYAITALSVVGIVFSVTLVPLTIASSQFGPTLLRAFLRDIQTQLTMGAFSATIGYNVFLILFLPSEVTDTTIPQISITVSLLFLLVSLGMLVYFFNHVGVSLQASSVVHVIGRELLGYIEKEYPADSPYRDLEKENADALRRKTLLEGKIIPSSRTGYIEAIDYNKLVRIAEEDDLLLYLKELSGAYVSSDDPLLVVWPPNHSKFALVTKNVKMAYIFSNNRTLIQDIQFGFSLLVVVASRALSAAINDPVTPIQCLDRIETALSKYVERRVQSPYHYDKKHNLRLITEPVDFGQLISSIFDPIRQSGTAQVLVRMLKAIGKIAAHVKTDTEKEALMQYAALIESDSRISLRSEYDRESVRHVYQEIMGTMELSHERKIQE
jgi:uncharacterized membrane protein